MIQSIKLQELDPSMLLGFCFRSPSEVDAFVDWTKEMGTEFPLFSLFESKQCQKSLSSQDDFEWV